MKIIEPCKQRFTLFGKSGAIRTFTTKKEILESLGYRWIHNNVGAHFKTLAYVTKIINDLGHVVAVDRVYAHHSYVLRDDKGSILVASDFNNSKGRRYKPKSTWNGEGPVPGVSKYSGRYYRHPKTQGNRAQAQSFGDSDEPNIRPKQSAAKMRTSWDDKFRSNGKSRCWKSYRNTQWK